MGVQTVMLMVRHNGECYFIVLNEKERMQHKQCFPKNHECKICNIQKKKRKLNSIYFKETEIRSKGNVQITIRLINCA